MDHVYGAAANVSGKLAGELAVGPLLHKIGEIAGPLVGPVAKRTVDALKRTRAWGLVAKAESREVAADVLRRAGGRPEAVERTLGAIEDSGEDVRWKGARSTARGKFPPTQSAPKGDMSTEAGPIFAQPLRSPGIPSEHLNAIEAPRNIDWNFRKMKSSTTGETDLDSGRIEINDIFDPYNHNRLLEDPEMVWQFVRALRHEWVHSVLTPSRGVPTAELRGWQAFARHLRKSLYTDN